MRQRRWSTTRSYPAIVMVAIVLATTAFTLVHYHKGSADQGCQLCHVRHLPGLPGAMVVARANPFTPQQDLTCDHSSEELDACVRLASSRAPPF